MNDFEHDCLDVYQAAIQFLAVADTIAGSLPRGRSYLADQLRRSLTAMVVKISGSGSGSGSGSD